MNNMKELIDRFKKSVMESNNKIKLHYEFKCTDANEDGIFDYTPFGEIDSTEFAQFIEDIEQHEISQSEFESKFELSPNELNIIEHADPEYLSFYDGSKETGYVVIFDGDIHYVYSV